MESQTAILMPVPGILPQTKRDKRDPQLGATEEIQRHGVIRMAPVMAQQSGLLASVALLQMQKYKSNP